MTPLRRKTLALLLALSLLPLTAGARTEGATVAEVIDGDTVRLADNRHLRLIGINAPELGHDREPDEPFAAPARERLRALVLGHPVKLVFEAEPRDRHGRWLAHIVLADGRSAEEILLREGLASLVAVPPNIAGLKRLQVAEVEARTARRGIWRHPYSAPIPADALGPGQTGYRFVRGHVVRVGTGRKYVYLDLGPRFSLRIAHGDWERYFGGRPESLLGTKLVARGWVSAHDGRLHMAIGHPAMLAGEP